MKRLCLLLCLASSSLALGQERPKIGLALGGGSARGIAHAGVLEWLEEQQIPIDYIAGTSMGGLVGGAYATGMSGAEIRVFLREIDWDLLFIGEPPYELRPFRRKEDRRQLPAHFELGLKQGASIPGGLDPGHQVGLVLSNMALAHSSIDDFDRLPTPFRTIATDLTLAEVVVIGEGSLTSALLSTMAIPAVFPPVRRGDRVLADGGLLNNVPADVARAMGADVVIAVDVGAVRNPVKLDSAVSAASQAIDVMMADDTRRTLENADVVITPDLRGFGSLDWRRSDALADLGRVAAEEHQEALDAYRLDDEAWAGFLEARAARTATAVMEPDFVEVVGAGRWTETVIRELAPFVGTPLDEAELQRSLTRITGTDRFESLRYEQKVTDGSLGLLITAKEKTHGPPFMRFAVDVNNERDDIDFNFSARLAMLDVGKPEAEMRIQGDLGSELGAAAEYYWPFAKGALFMAPRTFYTRATVNEFEGDDLVANRRERRAGGAFDIGVRTFTSAELRVGYQLSNVESTVRVGDPVLPQPTGKEELFRTRLVIDRVDAPLIPTKGVRLVSSLEWFPSAPETESSFGRFRVDGRGYIPVGDGHSIFLGGAAGFSFGDALPVLYGFTLGGPFRLSSFQPEAFRDENLAFATGGYLRKIGRMPDILGGPIYGIAIAETGMVFSDFDLSDLEYSAGGGLVVDTILGPVVGLLSGGSNGTFRFYVAIGRSLGN